MKIDEVISKAEIFAMNFIAAINDETIPSARKQAYFLDNQEDLQKYMAAMQKIMTSIDKDDSSEDEALLLNRAENIVNDLKTAIMEYQKELIIDSNISEEETTTALTQETISDAMKNNKTTQEISANMQAIAEQQKAQQPQLGFNYALVCDGQVNLINAVDKTQLTESINTVANGGNYANIQLYEISFKPVQLKKQTILTV